MEISSRKHIIIMTITMVMIKGAGVKCKVRVCEVVKCEVLWLAGHLALYPTVIKLTRTAANKNCELDPAPTWLMKMFASELSPFITVLFNASLRDSVFPSSQKCAVVTPVLKKPTLDASDTAGLF